MSYDPSQIPALVNYDTARGWADRVEIEGPFLRQILDEAPSSRVVDLGCGTGEPAAWLARAGFEVVGIEMVKERFEVAKRIAPDGVEILPGDFGAVEAMVRGRFGAAVCLGDTAPSVIGAEALARTFIGLRRRLLDRAPIVVHQLNYDRVFTRELDRLPERRRVVGGETLTFRRELRCRDDGVIGVTESTWLESSGNGRAERVHQHQFFRQGWRHEELLTVLDVAQFRSVDSFGGFAGEAFDPDRSEELVIVAR